MVAWDKTEVVRCHNCNEAVSVDADYCSSCNVKLNNKKTKGKIIVAALILIPIILTVIGVIFNDPPPKEKESQKDLHPPKNIGM